MTRDVYDRFSKSEDAKHLASVAAEARKLGDKKFARLVTAFASAAEAELEARRKNRSRARTGGQWKEMADLIEKEIGVSFEWDDRDSYMAFSKTIVGAAARRGFLAEVRAMEKAREAFSRAYDYAEERAAADFCPHCGKEI